LQPAFTNASNDATANSGVPIKTIRSDRNFSIAAKVVNSNLSLLFEVSYFFSPNLYTYLDVRIFKPENSCAFDAEEIWLSLTCKNRLPKPILHDNLL
jgi:hypothetical protein